jgi:hypothetical protein
MDENIKTLLNLMRLRICSSVHAFAHNTIAANPTTPVTTIGARTVSGAAVYGGVIVDLYDPVPVEILE